MISFIQFCENAENTTPAPFYNYNFIMAPSKVLGLNNTLNLPPVEPYGFWVNKFGHWIEVASEQHASVASNIMLKYNSQQPDENKQLPYKALEMPYMGLYQNGYIRMVDDNNVWRWEHPSRRFRPSESQLKFFKELNMEYHKGVERDDWMPNP